MNQNMKNMLHKEMQKETQQQSVNKPICPDCGTPMNNVVTIIDGTPVIKEGYYRCPKCKRQKTDTISSIQGTPVNIK